jgi:2,4-dienoyl-CoA reductase-like NADH-dependent reductase (Old Yellow Enzyme family)
MASKLFSPITIGGLTLANRIMVSPMSQFSSCEGIMSDWHTMHLGQFAVSGAGIVFTEVTGVEPEGRITTACAGLYDDASEAAMARVIGFCRRHGTSKVGLQLGHSGRKGSSHIPWEGNGAVSSDQGGWQPVAPSALPFNPKFPVPRALDEAGMARIKDAFVQATRRADRAGFDAIEIHGAHGFLVHQFLSPLSNHRNDRYGGDLEGRMRFPLEVFDAMRDVWPAAKALGLRVSATDGVDGGWDLAQTVEFAKALKAHGCDFIDISSGGLVPEQKFDVGPGYQTAFAAEVRRGSGLTTVAVGAITDPHQAEHIIRTGQADIVALARAFLFDPHWTWEAARQLGCDAPAPPQYRRGQVGFLNVRRDAPTGAASS